MARVWARSSTTTRSPRSLSAMPRVRRVVPRSASTSLSAPSGREVKVDYATVEGTAKAPGDYAPASGKLTFAPGRPASRSASPRSRTRSMRTTRRSRSGSRIRSRKHRRCQRRRDHRRRRPAPLAVRQRCALASGGWRAAHLQHQPLRPQRPASEGQLRNRRRHGEGAKDYKRKSGTLNFAPGETSQEVSVPSVQDTVREPDETFTLRLSKPAQATIADADGLAKILNDD